MSVDQGYLAEVHREAQKPPNSGSILSTLGRGCKLYWYMCKCVFNVVHLFAQVKKELQGGNSMPVIIPGGCASVVQPLDVSLNKPFKGHVRVEWLAFMEKAVTELEKQQEDELSDDPFDSSDEDDSNDEIQKLLSRPKPVFVKPASKQLIIDWVASAWKKVEAKPAMVAKSFIVTGIA